MASLAEPDGKLAVLGRLSAQTHQVAGVCVGHADETRDHNNAHHTERRWVLGLQPRLRRVRSCEANVDVIVPLAHHERIRKPDKVLAHLRK